MQFEWYRGLAEFQHSSQSNPYFGTGAFFVPTGHKGGRLMKQITALDYKIGEMAARIRELREIEGRTAAEMAQRI